MATYYVSSGQTVSNTLVYGDVEYVSSGGSTNNQVNGGQRFVLSGGVVSNGSVSSGGKDYISAGGSSVNGYIVSGGIRYVSSGAVAINPYVGSNGNVLLSAGADLNGATISGGGANIYASPDVTLSGTITVEQSAYISGGILESGAQETLTYYARTSGQTVNSGATLDLEGSTSGSNITLNGGTILMRGSVLSNTIFAGSSGTIYAGSSGRSGLVIGSSGAVLADGNTIIASGLGIASGITVGSGGSIIASGGGATVNDTIQSGGKVDYTSGGILSGVLSAQSGATIISATLSGAGNRIVADSGTLLQGYISATTSSTISGGVIGSGVTEDLSYYTSAYSQTIESGGALILRGSTSGSNISLDGGSITMNGSILSGINFIGSNGTVTLNNGSAYQTSSSTALTDGNTVNVNASGLLVNQRVGSGGVVNVSGTISAATLDGGTINLYRTSASLNTTFASNGGTINFESGYNDPRGWSLTNNVLFNVLSGANVSAATISSGARINVENGGTVSGTVVNGGTLELNGTSGSLNTTFTSNGGTVILDSKYSDTREWIVSKNVTFAVSSGAKITPTTVLAGGSVMLSAGAAVSSTMVVSSGGAVSAAPGATNSGTITIQNGGQVTLDGTAGGKVLLNGSTNSGLTLTGSGNPSVVISGFDGTSTTASDVIIFRDIDPSTITSVTYGQTADGTFISSPANAGASNASSYNYLRFTLKDGSTVTTNIPGVGKYGYNLESIGDPETGYEVCFAEGTMIATPDGEAAIETLVPGTIVSTANGPMAVKWQGRRSIDVARQRVPEENWLVRIRADALADGVPARDLLVTQEHCMVFEGKLVPARMLVNDVSIILDRTISAYTYFHIELDTHEAIWAEGALTESYLDTGNRRQFENNDVTTLSVERIASGSSNLPLDTSRSFVEPIHASIMARAGASKTPIVTTEDPDLHLTTDCGQVIRPLRKASGRYVFMIPAHVTEIRLRSRANRPSDILGPFVDDRRMLGVLVGKVSFFKSKLTMPLTGHLSDPTLQGWHGLEAAAYRWTSGNAVMPLTAFSGDNEQGILAIEIVTAGPYLADDTHVSGSMRRAG